MGQTINLIEDFSIHLQRNLTSRYAKPRINYPGGWMPIKKRESLFWTITKMWRLTAPIGRSAIGRGDLFKVRVNNLNHVFSRFLARF